MNAPVTERVSATKVGGLVIFLIIGWLGLQFLPDPAPPPPAPFVVGPPSKLAQAGLPDDPDFEGLPDLFAIWAGHARWQDNKSVFAYWHPASQSYAYYFEAIRQNEGYRFRVVSREELSRKRVYYYEGMDDIVSNEVPELKSQTETHPFVFLSDTSFELIRVVNKPGVNFGSQPASVPGPTRVEVDLKPPAVTVPKPVIEQESQLHDPVKK